MRALGREVSRSKKEHDVSVIVGYTAKYALFVHEKIEMVLQGQPRPGGRGFFWDPQGRAQAKFLEAPARALAPMFANMITDMCRGGMSLVRALLIVGLRLQRESQQMAPVLTGNLKASAFTRQE